MDLPFIKTYSLHHPTSIHIENFVKACVALAGAPSGSTIDNLGVSVCTNISNEETQQSLYAAAATTL